ncbi:MAG: hypothetical protein HKN53_09215, partial [Maribacter sp.]|nr:hypothetical protein [Maribacter sp.]
LGLYDEVGLGLAYPFLIQKLDALDVTYTYETFEGGHFTKTFERLAVSLAFCSDSMNP